MATNREGLAGRASSAIETYRYRYPAILPNQIRLLRVAPGLFTSTLVLALKVVSLQKILDEEFEFQALSYAWGEDKAENIVQLSNLPSNESGSATQDTDFDVSIWKRSETFPIRQNPFHALRRIRLVDSYTWVWVDAICMDQSNDDEKSEQLQKMLKIYSSAYNVIAWLGEDDGAGSDVCRAIDLIPNILNLKTLDLMLRNRLPNQQEALQHWKAFGRLLQRSWFSRHWVIQEVACAWRLSVRVGEHILSWQDFADAIDLYSKNIDIIRALPGYGTQDDNGTGDHEVEESSAMALIEMSRNVFRREQDTRAMSRLMTLEMLVSTASGFAVTDLRDIVYALLYLANDRYQAAATRVSGRSQVLRADYSLHVVDIFINFVGHCLQRSGCLDVICRQWAMWPESRRDTTHEGRTLPTWIGVAVFAKTPTEALLHPMDNIVGTAQHRVYNASGEAKIHASISGSILQADGILLNLIYEVSDPIREGIVDDRCLRMLGWRGDVSEEVEENIWRTLVANRRSSGTIAPAWYRRACALALTMLEPNRHFDTTRLMTGNHLPSTVVEYASRVHKATSNRRVFHSTNNSLAWAGLLSESADSVVGLGPPNIKRHDMVCILFGCSVPVVLRQIVPRNNAELWSPDFPSTDVVLVGPCYVHGHMEEGLLMKQDTDRIRSKTVTLNLH
ncbi:heterokaryon incompatibility protein-domain-containing protein [Phaeosphaeria sp. MPI-PUGE-AT-0046c]|nr:heterokaryon incompatibility protein-domain-containing protein [Phaeosphaeria sp. MPI-PUGE-AT-0046c]